MVRILRGDPFRNKWRLRLPRNALERPFLKRSAFRGDENALARKLNEFSFRFPKKAGLRDLIFKVEASIVYPPEAENAFPPSAGTKRKEIAMSRHPVKQTEEGCGITAIGRNCFGCGVCACICPRTLLSIRLNKNGFFAPVATNDPQCIHCNLCLSVCPCGDDLPAVPAGRIEPEAWSAGSRRERIRNQSSAGGIARELAEEWMERGRRVCTAVFNAQENCLEHLVLRTPEELVRSAGAKYLQSYTLPGFSHLNGHERFLVIGTPCQIDGLRRYLRKRHWEEHFVLVDFFCRGVPSMRLWLKFTRFFKKKRQIFTDVAWQEKTNGKKEDRIVFTGKDGTRTAAGSRRNELFFGFYRDDLCLGSACYDRCKYKGTASAADLRLGEFQPSQTTQDCEATPGTILVLTEKGRRTLEETAPRLNRHRLTLDDVLAGQMARNAVRPRDNAVFRLFLRSAMPLNLILKWKQWTRLLLYLPQELRRRFRKRS